MGRVAKVFYLNLLTIFCAITSIQADCKVHVPEDHSLRPTVYKSVGKWLIKTHENYIVLHENQVLEAQCDVSFENRATNQLFIKCSNYIFIRSDKEQSYTRASNYNQEITLKCSTKKWKLFESSTELTWWCPVASGIPYYVGRPKRSNNGYDYFAGICYDSYGQCLLSVYYTLAPKYSHYEKPIKLENSKEIPRLEIQYIKESFSANSISASDFDNEHIQNMITYANYEYSSIMQMAKLNSTFNEQFSSLLQFVWWPNLRLNNWKRYEAALEKHIESDSQAYDILAGVSGTLKAPIIENCQTNYTMKKVIDKNDRTFPLYVWNYLQASYNDTNQIVIIGFNSPFYEFYAQEDIIFCPDKCQALPWLQEVSSTFRYGIMGIVFCCSVEDVQSSKRLLGFPVIDLKPQPIEKVVSANNLNATAELNSEPTRNETVESENSLNISDEEENDD